MNRTRNVQTLAILYPRPKLHSAYPKILKEAYGYRKRGVSAPPRAVADPHSSGLRSCQASWQLNSRCTSIPNPNVHVLNQPSLGVAGL